MRLRVLLVLTVALTGCGGGGGLSTDDYRAEARKICRDADRDSESVQEPTRATNAAIVDYFEQLLATNEKSTERFKALDPPEDLEKAHDAAVKANEEGATEVRRLIADLEDGGDARQILTAAQPRLQALQRTSDEAAGKLGVRECSD